MYIYTQHKIFEPTMLKSKCTYKAKAHLHVVTGFGTKVHCMLSAQVSVASSSTCLLTVQTVQYLMVAQNTVSDHQQLQFPLSRTGCVLSFSS